MKLSDCLKFVKLIGLLLWTTHLLMYKTKIFTKLDTDIHLGVKRLN